MFEEYYVFLLPSYVFLLVVLIKSHTRIILIGSECIHLLNRSFRVASINY